MTKNPNVNAIAVLILILSGLTLTTILICMQICLHTLEIMVVWVADLAASVDLVDFILIIVIIVVSKFDPGNLNQILKTINL